MRLLSLQGWWRRKVLRLSLNLSVAAICASATFAQMRQFPNRTEGTWSPHGSSDMDLIGLSRSPIDFDPRSTLRVQFFLPVPPTNAPPNYADTVVLESREIIALQNYYMRSKPGHWQPGRWNEFGPWPTSDVLDPLGIRASNLALTASYGDATGGRVYMPVSVSTLPAVSKSDSYIFQFNTAWPVHSLERKLTGPDGHTESLPIIGCQATPLCILYDADSSHAFAIDMTNRPEGLYRLHLTGHVPNNSFTPELFVTFYHRAS